MLRETLIGFLMKKLEQNFCFFNDGSIVFFQGRREDTSSVVFEVLIMNCEIDFIIAVHLQLFSVKYMFVHLQLFDVKFLFSEKTYLASRRKRLFMDVRPYFRILNSPRKMRTCYLQDTNKFLRYLTLCMSILKYTNMCIPGKRY